MIFSVLLVELFTLGVAYYWGLTFNFLVSINLSFALGITVDYSAHIAHTYLRVPGIHGRNYKARKAISRMGSSVSHAAISTSLGVSVLAFAKTYTVRVFFKTWITFLLAGFANSILLLPVLLTIFGSTTSSEETNYTSSKATMVLICTCKIKQDYTGSCLCRTETQTGKSNE